MSCSMGAKYQLEQYICELRVAIDRAELAMCGHRRGTIVIPEKLRNEIIKLLDIITREIENGTKNGDTFDGWNVDHHLSRAKEIVTNSLNRGIKHRNYELWSHRFGPRTIPPFQSAVREEWAQDQFGSNLGERYENRRYQRMKKLLIAAGRKPESEEKPTEKLKPVEEEEHNNQGVRKRDSFSIEVESIPDATGSTKDKFQFLFQETARKCLSKTPHAGIIAIAITTVSFIFALHYCF